MPMAKYGDLLAGLLALFYTILAVVLKNTGVADLGEFLAQPALSGPFAMAALMRGWNTLTKHKKAAVVSEAQSQALAAEGSE